MYIISWLGRNRGIGELIRRYNKQMYLLIFKILFDSNHILFT